MWKKNRTKMIIASIIILLPIVAGVILWDKLPEQIVTHWGADGTPNGWSSKGFAVFGIPLFLFVVQWLCLLMANADPKRKNYSDKMFNIVLAICPVISVLIAILSYGTAMGLELSVHRIMPVFLGITFIVIGNYLPKCKQSYTLGIKLPWTLADEDNWNYTHRLGGKLWVICGVIVTVCAVCPENVMSVILLVVLSVATIIPTIFSYLFYKKKMKGE